MVQINPKILIMGNKRQISTDKDRSPVYRILVVDDDPDITLAFKKGLEENGSFLVSTFNDPQQTLAQFKANFYNLLVLDIRMPKMNGFGLYRELKKIDANPKVCFVNAYETYYEDLKKDFPTLAVSCFIKKPI
jgi:DNA-binding NtrC family response regulator